MATREQVQQLLDEGLDYEAAGQRLGIPADRPRPGRPGAGRRKAEPGRLVMRRPADACGAG
jgi:hypothetical protein